MRSRGRFFYLHLVHVLAMVYNERVFSMKTLMYTDESEPY